MAQDINLLIKLFFSSNKILSITDFIFQEGIFFKISGPVKRNQFKLTFLVKRLTKPEGRTDQRGGSIKVDVSTFNVIACFLKSIPCRITYSR